MKYSIKFCIKRFWWRLFVRWKYDHAKKFEKAFNEMPDNERKELAEKLWKAITKDINQTKP